MSLKTPIMACSLGLITTCGAIAFNAIPGRTQAAGFTCDNSSGSPTTVYYNRQGGQEPWIRWVSNSFAGAGYDPLTRCREVSNRLETYRSNKQLKYITVGMMNRQPVVCTASQVNGRCEGLIFTLKRGQDAVRTLNNLLAWREGQAATPSLRESGAVPYIDVSARLQDDGNAATTSTRSSVKPAQAPGQMDGGTQPSGGSREL
jgi:hypothetical protein